MSPIIFRITSKITVYNLCKLNRVRYAGPSDHEFRSRLQQNTFKFLQGFSSSTLLCMLQNWILTKRAKLVTFRLHTAEIFTSLKEYCYKNELYFTGVFDGIF